MILCLKLTSLVSIFYILFKHCRKCFKHKNSPVRVRRHSVLVMKTSRPSSSSLVTTTSSVSRASSPTTPTTPLPELTLVAENLRKSKSRLSKSGNSNKYRVASAAVNQSQDETRHQDKDSVHKLKENLRFCQLRLWQTGQLSFKFVWESFSLYFNNFLMNYKNRQY